MAEESTIAVGEGGAPVRRRHARLRGNQSVLLDEKHRVTIPAQMRPQLLGIVVLAVLDGRLCLWPEDVFEELTEHLDGQVRINELTPVQYELFMTSAVDTRLDAQGRVTLSEALRAEAGIDRRVTVAGVGPHLVILRDGAYEAMAVERDESVTDAIALARF